MFPSFFQMPFTYVITISIFIVSIIGFYHKPLYHALLFHPYEVFRGKRIHTLLTSAFVHKGWKHLLINLYIFYIMAKDVETLILNESYSPVQIKIIWLFIFLFSAVLGNLITGWLQKDNINYTSVGASGITFSFTIFAMLYFPLDHSNKPHKFLPLYYGYDYTFAILVICIAMFLIYRKKSKSNHKIHLTGALIGLALAILFRPVLVTEIIYHLKSRW